MALGVDQIDLYQLNVPDPKIPFEDSVGALADLKREGKIRWVGLSNVTVEQIEIGRKIVDVTSIQNRLNLIYRECIASGVVSYCAQHGMAFLAYHPVGGGLHKELGKHKCLQRISKVRNASPHAVALAWCLAQGTTVIPIPSARTVAHALDSISAAHLELTESDLMAIDSAEFTQERRLYIRVRGMIGNALRRAGIMPKRRTVWSS